MAALFASALVESPALAQLDGPELVGSYPVEMRAQGQGCPPLRRTTFEVRSVSGNRLQVALGGEWGSGELRGLFEGGEREFYLSFRELDGVRARGMQGFFERRGGAIGVVIAVMFADGVDCTGELQGRRRGGAAPAAPVATPPPPPAAPPPAAPPAEPAPSPIGPAADGMRPLQAAPEGPPQSTAQGLQPPAAPERPSRLLQLLRVLGLAVLGSALGFGLVRLFRGRGSG